MQIKLSQPFHYKDHKLEVLNFDIENLTGRDLINCENNLRTINPNAPLWGTEHLLCIAEKSSKINANELANLPAKDFMKIQVALVNFFSDALSSEPQAS